MKMKNHVGKLAAITQLAIASRYISSVGFSQETGFSAKFSRSASMVLIASSLVIRCYFLFFWLAYKRISLAILCIIFSSKLLDKDCWRSHLLWHQLATHWECDYPAIVQGPSSAFRRQIVANRVNAKLQTGAVTRSQFGTQPLPGINSRLPGWLLQPVNTTTSASRTRMTIRFMPEL